jgi:hypothetical protein
MRKILVIVLFLTPLIGYAAVLMTGVVFIDIKLLDKPSYEGKVIANLAADAEITVEQRQGSWTKVATAEDTGWVPTLTIRIKSVTSREDFKAAAVEVSGKIEDEANTQVVATMGIRGLDEEELKQAKFNKKQLVLLESYYANKKQLAAFSQAGELKSKQIAYIGEEQNSHTVEVIELSQ